MFEFLKRNEGNSVHVNNIDEIVEKIELIDIREPYEYVNGSHKISKNIPMGDLLSAPNKYLNKETTYYIMCLSGGRSARACSALKSQSYNVINVAGGIGSYTGSNRK